MHKVDLSNYELRTDLAIDCVDKNNRENNIETYYDNNIKVTWINIDNDIIKNTKQGTYLTLEFSDVTDDDNLKKVSHVLKKELEKLLKKEGFRRETKTLVVGLGNKKSTPDSLGTIATEKIIVTRHLYDINNVGSNFTNVAALLPGVYGVTGIETLDILRGIVNEIKPDMLIVIDSLCSTSITRVNKSIQVTNVGISPGSGIGNKREEISKKSIGIPVVAIGVPTVLSASVIVNDTINFIFKNYSYNKLSYKKKYNKLINKPINYLNKKIDVSKDEKKTLLGLVGNLTEEELSDLIYEVLTPIGYNLIVTPKEIDFVVEKLGNIISYAINNCLHKL